MPEKLGIIGGGVMGEALLSRLIAEELYQPSEVLVSDPAGERRQQLIDRYGINATSNNHQALSTTEAVLLAVKPQIFSAIAAEAAETAATAQPLLISIMAGVTLSRLEAAFPGWPIVRAMPNTPATVGAGMTAIAAGKKVTSEQQQLTQQIFQSVGQVVSVSESLMDAVTGLSGSGPGYVAIMIEALADGGVAAGLPRAIALQLAIQTVKGTAELLQSTELHPAVLKDRVTSPGGTTIAGIARLESLGLRTALIEAVRTACQRSQELGE